MNRTLEWKWKLDSANNAFTLMSDSDAKKAEEDFWDQLDDLVPFDNTKRFFKFPHDSSQYSFKFANTSNDIQTFRAACSEKQCECNGGLQKKQHPTYIVQRQVK